MHIFALFHETGDDNTWWEEFVSAHADGDWASVQAAVVAHFQWQDRPVTVSQWTPQAARTGEAMWRAEARDGPDRYADYSVRRVPLLTSARIEPHSRPSSPRGGSQAVRPW